MKHKVEIECVFIRREYFEINRYYVKILDSGNFEKQCKRMYLFLKVTYQDNNFYIPLRKNLGNGERIFGKIGYNLPTATKPLAGLDYRYMLIVNDKGYIEHPKELRIPKSQYLAIEENYATIEKEVITYVKGYVKVAKKNRVDRTAKYRESSLINFHSELKI